jgi:uncharacterized protein YbjT (DUF2867 family)
MKILVLGATGNTGSLVVSNLKSKGADFAILTKNKTEAQRFGLADEQVNKGNFNDLASLVRAMQGIGKIYLVMPMHQDVVKWVNNVIEAAKQAGVKHIVKQSGLEASVKAESQIIRDHAESDQLIKNSGLEYTLIQPNSFFQNFYGNLPTINAVNQFYSPLSDSKQSMVDLNDVVEAVSLVLTQTGHEGKIYRFTGGEALTSAEQAEFISQSSGKNISFVNVSKNDFESALKDAGMNDWIAENLADMIAWFAKGKPYGEISEDIESLLGRSPRSFADFSKELATSIKA